MNQSHSFNTTTAEFAEKVIKASHQQPVMVDFWANWCGPCKMLMPRLEQICEQYQGRFLLAKVESDQHRQLISDYEIRNIPTVLLFKNGQPVERFSGVIADEEICALLDNQLSGPADEHLNKAKAALQQQQHNDAKQQIELALEHAEDSSRIIAEANSLLIEMGEYQLATDNLQQLPTLLATHPKTSALQAQLSFTPFLDKASSLEQLQLEISNEPQNLALYLKIAAHQVLHGKTEAAMENLLAIIKQDPSFENGIARTQMRRIFEMLKNSGELVQKYRLQMAKYLL